MELALEHVAHVAYLVGCQVGWQTQMGCIEGKVEIDLSVMSKKLVIKVVTGSHVAQKVSLREGAGNAEGPWELKS